MDDGGSEPNVYVARCSLECQTGYANPLAPERVPPVLALEIQADGKTAFSEGPAATDPTDGRRECDMGRGTHRQRTEAETRNTGFAPHRGKVPAQGSTGAHARSKAALAEFRP